MRRRTIGSALVALALSPSCSEEPVARPRPAPTVAPPSVWVAVVAVGEPAELEDEEGRILRRAPQAVAVAPHGCWEGLSEELGPGAPGSYVAALVAPTQEALDAAVDAVDLPTLVIGSFHPRCGR